MPIYTVHEPPRRDDELLAHTARFAFVRDGFHFWAFLLAPLWMLRHRLWLELIVYLLLTAGITFALRRLGVAESAGGLVWFLMSLLVGMEAPTNLGQDYQERFHDLFIQLLRDFRGRITFVPFLLEGVAGNPALNQPDGIHPTVEGQQIIAGTLYTPLKNMVDMLTPGGG